LFIFLGHRTPVSLAGQAYGIRHPHRVFFFLTLSCRAVSSPMADQATLSNCLAQTVNPDANARKKGGARAPFAAPAALRLAALHAPAWASSASHPHAAH